MYNTVLHIPVFHSSRVGFSSWTFFITHHSLICLITTNGFHQFPWGRTEKFRNCIICILIVRNTLPQEFCFLDYYLNVSFSLLTVKNLLVKFSVSLILNLRKTNPAWLCCYLKLESATVSETGSLLSQLKHPYSNQNWHLLLHLGWTRVKWC